MWVLVILDLHKSSEIISRLQDPMKGIKLNLQGKNAKVRKRWGKGPHVTVFSIQKVHVKYLHVPTNMTCMNKIVICSPSDYASPMAFMVDLTSCGIELVTSSPFEMFTSLGSLPSLPFVLGTSTFAFGSSKGFDGDCSTFVAQWRWSWCPWYRWLDPFTPCMFQWKLYGGSCPFAGRCQFADSRIRRLGESHFALKFTSTNRLCVPLWDVSSCLSEDVFFNWASPMLLIWHFWKALQHSWWPAYLNVHAIWPIPL